MNARKAANRLICSQQLQQPYSDRQPFTDVRPVCATKPEQGLPAGGNAGLLNLQGIALSAACSQHLQRGTEAAIDRLLTI